MSGKIVTQCHTVLPLSDAEIYGAHAPGCQHLRPEAAQDNSGECGSAVGVTVGLVDALMSIARVLSRRNLSHQVVKEALRDLQTDHALMSLLRRAE